MVARVKKNDTVVILSGKDQGRQGTVLEILPKKNKVIVKGCGLVTRHLKPKKQGQVGGIKKQESFLEVSQIMPVCSSCDKPCRINTHVLENGSRVRMCNRCQKVF
jgi:large subunit ribosomal protein L24